MLKAICMPTNKITYIKGKIGFISFSTYFFNSIEIYTNSHSLKNIYRYLPAQWCSYVTLHYHFCTHTCLSFCTTPKSNGKLPHSLQKGCFSKSILMSRMANTNLSKLDCKPTKKVCKSGSSGWMETLFLNQEVSDRPINA